ncbi:MULTISPECIES: sulfatase-like hydrolase/transferase [Nostocales]|uniref:Sulfatase-like hydrolase/transferase n=3 Tax=Nostocales TaxID=1161 RepID=A0A8S9T9L0_9CYAN|nr:sulfatase-like hydrolase/transferase [Tolypothrix bouteillei]KAF3888133.1 sulfatase-like hydrolase/transferase [Tolypothrix bouteillei VB521301]
MKRRTFLSTTGLTGAALIGSQLLVKSNASAITQTSEYKKPNILVIVVDQLRTPKWFPAQATLDSLLPYMAKLRKSSVSFTRYYTAATACTAARGTLVTGLYSHQTYVMDTHLNDGSGKNGLLIKAPAPSLNPGFPTWGKLLRDNFGYSTWWFGKWHLSTTNSLEPYGFSGGTYPSPNGNPGEGLAVDSYIVNGGKPPQGIQATEQFAQWLNSNDAKNTPWCTTISLINPHDISWYPRGTKQIPEENNPPSIFKDKIPNFENPIELRKKPRLQEAFRRATNIGAGFVPPNFGEPWLKMLDSYLLFQQFVDTQIGKALDILENSPYAKNTIIVFTSDHGEYGGSHGLRGKSAAVYEESINVPLYIKDPTKQWVSTPGTERTQLCSSVDIVPLLLTLASGDNQWRRQSAFKHLSTRLDIAQILRQPYASGRSYILHTTDELILELVGELLVLGKTPNHIIGYRTDKAKLGAYNFWRSGTIDIETKGMEIELYNYSTVRGQQELDNVSNSQPKLYKELVSNLFNDAIPNELRKPLTSPELQAIQQQALKDYLSFASQTTQSKSKLGKTDEHLEALNTAIANL